MNRCEISIDGRSYPCRQVMGAALRFKHETGLEFTAVQKEISEGVDHTSEVCVWLWCCVASSCAADGVEFPYDIMGFLDRLTPEEVVRAMTEMAEAEAPAVAAGGAGPKKAAAPRRR